MPKKHRVFSYTELIEGLSGAQNPQTVAGVLILALDSWRKNVINNYAMGAILQKACFVVQTFGD